MGSEVILLLWRFQAIEEFAKTIRRKQAGLSKLNVGLYYEM